LWSSVDDGQTWTLVSAQTSIGNFTYTTLIFDSQFYLYLFGGQNGVGSQYNWAEVSVRSTQPIVNAAARALGSSSSTAGAVSSTAATTTGSVGQSFDFYPYGTVQYEADTTVAALVAPLSFSALGGMTAPAGSFLIFGCVFGAAILPAANSNTATALANTTFVAAPVSTYGAVGCAARKGSNR
jgi:hypothetical protein